jgi:hypothetical protein
VSGRPHLLRGYVARIKTHVCGICRHMSSSVMWSILYLPTVGNVLSHRNQGSADGTVYIYDTMHWSILPYSPTAPATITKRAAAI